MKKFLFVATAMTVILSSHTADARRGGGGGYSEGLLFVAETQEVGQNGRALSLCILERTQKIMMIPLWRSARSYVLAPDLCTGTQYFELPAERLALGKMAGYFPADLPAEPQLTFEQKAAGAWGLGLLVPLLFFGIVRILGEGIRRNEPASFPSRALQIMCLVAKCDRNVSETEIRLIQNILGQITKQNIPLNVVAEMVESMPNSMTDRELKKLGKGLDQAHRDVLVQAAAMIAGGDGRVEGGESHIIYRISKALKVDGAKVDDMIDRSMPSHAMPAE